MKLTAGDAARGATVAAVVVAERKQLAGEGVVPDTELAYAVRKVVVEDSCKPEVPAATVGAGAGNHFGRFRHLGLGRHGRRAKIDRMPEPDRTEQEGSWSQGC